MIPGSVVIRTIVNSFFLSCKFVILNRKHFTTDIEKEKMKKNVSKSIAIILAFCIAFSGLPFLAGELDVHAASKKVAKKVMLQAAASGQDAVVLKWNKIKKPQKGYAVFRDGTPIAHVGKKRTFTDTGLQAGSSHTYQIKVYKTQKVKMWYNKATGKWQKKKPAKNNRGKSKKVTTYTYRKPSNAVNVRTEPGPVSSGTEPDNTEPGNTEPPDTSSIPAPTNLKYSNLSSSSVTLSWTAASISGTPSYKLYRKDGNGNTKVTPVSTISAKDISVVAGTTYQYYVTTIYNGQESVKSNMIMVKVPSETVTTQTKTVTDYTGRTFQIYKNSNESFWRYTSNDVAVESMPKIDKTVDGEFDIGSNHMIQYHGATFNATAIKNAKPNNYDYIVDMYNGEASKFSIELQDGVYVDWIDTYKEVGNHKYEPTVKYYYFKSGHPIAMPVQTDGQFVYKTETSGNITKKHFYVDNAAMSVGDAVGIWTDVFNVYVKYDGKLIETITIDTARDENLGTSWTSQTANGMSPWRRVALNIAEQAISSKGGSTGKLYQDLHLISDYIDENYTYGEVVPVYGTTMSMKCIAGAIILETYSIVHYNKYGFESSGSNYYDGNHSAFNLNEDPDTYYEANGHLD